ncbi:MAG: hypothetical protein ACHQRO_04020 [Vicinamibacteria bacterium]
MPFVDRLRLPALVAATVLMAACSSDTPKAPPQESAVAQSPVAVTEAWRAKHDTDYRRDWASIAGMYPLKPGANTSGSAATAADGASFGVSPLQAAINTVAATRAGRRRPLANRIAPAYSHLMEAI